MHSKTLWVCLILILTAGFSASATQGKSGPSSGTPQAPGVGSLDLAFRFASAIQSDPKDQAKAQEAVLRDFLLLGADDEAASRTAQVRGWRRGVLYAELAEHRAAQGDAEAARDLIEKARGVRSETQGWEGPRVDAEIAAALAALGDLASSERIALDLAAADPRQYSGRAAATVSQAQTALGNFEKAMEALAPVDGDADVEVSGARTSGYLGIAREKKFTLAQRLAALQAAESSAASLPSWEEVGVLTEIARLYRETGQRERCAGALRKAQEIALSLPGSAAGKIPLMAQVAQGWAEAGEKSRARTLLLEAEPAAAKAFDIDRPGAYARLASAWRALGDTKQANRLTALAISSAESLRNARPRALSAVDICRSLGRDGVEPDPGTRGRLELLLANLKDPW
jgi:tetratricopeptide (TPR) repeat protein